MGSAAGRSSIAPTPRGTLVTTPTSALWPSTWPPCTSSIDRPGPSSPTASLALKVLAHRVGEDEDDVRLLAKRLELRTADEVLAVATEVFGDRLDVAARFFVEEIFA